MTGTNADQATFWDSEAGPKWVRHADAMDACLAPVTQAVLDAANLQSGGQVLDIGCGAGHSTLQAAGLVGSEGQALGVDISNTLLALAKNRARHVPQAHFTLADAETHPFEAGQFDALISRFGVMFFDNPVAAFANMARALKPGGRIAFAAWGQIPENPFFTLPAAAVRQVLGAAPPKADPDAPGPFAFRNPERVLRILKEAGLRATSVDVQHIPLPIAGGPDEAAAVWKEIGPVDRAFRHFDTPPAQQEEVLSTLKEMLRTHIQDGALMIPSEINIFSAQMA